MEIALKIRVYRYYMHIFTYSHIFIILHGSEKTLDYGSSFSERRYFTVSASSTSIRVDRINVRLCHASSN